MLSVITAGGNCTNVDGSLFLSERLVVSSASLLPSQVYSKRNIMAIRGALFAAIALLSSNPVQAGWKPPYHGSHKGPGGCGYPGGGPTATIDAGVVIGTTTSLPAATASVNKFLGVPFAKSPPTRFAPPQSPGKFGQPIMAKQWSPACIQQFQYPKSAQQFTEAVFNNPAPEESEDCL